jgi:1-acyl-sn-glycerol-3-phosphate acyltransferase
MTRLLRHAFFLLIVRPVVLVILGINLRHRERLPARGPAIVVANHNSHLDTLVLMTLFPSRMLDRLRPVAAADYFLRGRWRSWFARNIIGIIPLERQVRAKDGDPLRECGEAIGEGSILILFPEGSRGEPERLTHFKSGVAHLARRYPQVPVHPVFLHGLGKALPRGEALLVPFFVDVFVGEAVPWAGERAAFMDALEAAIERLAAEGTFPLWD